MFWGILSLLMFDVFQPAASWIIRQIPRQAGNILLLVLLVITALDIVYSVIMTVNFRKQLEKLYEFRKELEYLLEDLEFPSPREFLSSTARELSGKFTAESFSEYKEAFYQKLASVKGNSAENDSKRALAEERLRFYWENRSRFLKKRPVIGNQRLLDAFPGMKILSKNHTAIEVKELLLMIRQKTNSLDRHRKQEKE
jgi:hypothetical protein